MLSIVHCVNLQWYIAWDCLGNLVELVIRPIKVIILLTKKCFILSCVVLYRADYMLIIYVLDALSSFNYLEIC
jgi:hypothetical protein